MKKIAINTKVMLPVLIGSMLSVLLFGAAMTALLYGLAPGFTPLVAVPLVLLMGNDALVTSRMGVLGYHHARRSHQQLYEYMLGNGASVKESLSYFVLRSVTMTCAHSRWRWLAVAVLSLPLLLAVVLMSALTLLEALLVLLGVMLVLVAASVSALVAALCLYERLHV